jgi:cell fate (sporulation/competence/biofilm development) regulator YlbF (YheA/YmcA/DUF963 family)
MKPIGVRIFSVAMLLILAACGGDKYADARDIMKDHAQVMEAYITGLENAANAADCAAAIDAYSAGMEDLIPRLKAFREKYPELMKEGDSETPAEVEKEAERLEELSARMPAATMNMMKYMTDPQVQEAMQRMSQAMEKMGE